jgi:CarD family transcriptional regulator
VIIKLLGSGRSDKIMFNIGDKVVYPLHGAGVIESIEEKAILDERQSYYIIKMPGEVKVMVPTAKAEAIGVRSIIDKESALKVINVLSEESTEMSMNWNKRYRDNMEKMKTGNIYEVADIVRNLSFKQKDKGLSTGEKKMLLNAKQILVSELVLVENKAKNEIEELVEGKINESYEAHLEAVETETPVAAGSENTPNIIKKFIPQV